MPKKAKAPVCVGARNRGRTNTTTVAKQMEPWHGQDTPSSFEFQHNCYQQAMKPQHMPEVFVLMNDVRTAA